ncbi:MAG TPA: glycosyltransferase family 4 protein [Anaerolineae bacterium]
MKIVYSISARLGGSGIGYIAYNAVSGIHQSGLLARVFASSNTSDIPAPLVRQWGTLGQISKYLGAKDRSGLIYYLESNLFDAWTATQLPAGDVFHGWNGMCLRTLQTAKRRGMVTVVERASSHPSTQSRLLREEYARWNIPFEFPSWNERRSLRELDEADYITTPSAFARQSLIDAGLPEHKLLEIPFGADLNRFHPTTDVAPHPFRAIFVGQVSIRKGVPYLLEAWQRLGWRDAELWIVGGVTPDFAALRHRWVNVAGVQFVPHTTDVARLCQQSDVFVFPSIEEGSALVTYEALACGLPVITTPNSGSVVRDGEDGFIVSIRDVDALCDRLERLRANAALRAQMGRSARERAEQFSWAKYQTKLVTYYQRIARK